MGLFSFVTERSRLSAPGPVNFASPKFKANPYPFYTWLRAEAPVYRATMPLGFWLVTRYDDVVMVLKDERFVKDTANAMTPEQLARLPWYHKLFKSKLFKSLIRTLINLDPPDHTRIRAIVNKAFAPRLIEQMRERIQSLADELLDAVQICGRMDLICDYALPMPTTIITEILGVPAKDRRQFHRWSNAIGSMFFSKWAVLRAIPNMWALMCYIRKFIKKRRADPRNDLVSALIRAEEAGDTLSEDELLGMIVLLLLAGYETTANLIGNGTLALLENPDQMEKLRNDPVLIRPAVEELLRYAGAADMATARYARENVTIAGVTIPRGQAVFAVIASANRDERQFPNPDTLDITREPNKHVAFGLANHFCLGAALARLECQIAIGTLLQRVPDLRLTVATNKLRWRPGLMLRGLESLPLAFDKDAGKG